MKKILVVDDDLSIRNLLNKLLRQNNFEVLTAADSEEGLEIMAKHEIELVITDILMPNTIGLAVSHEAEKRKIPAIVISGGIPGAGGIKPEEYFGVAKRTGAVATFAKPLALNKLLEKIFELLKIEIIAGQTPICPVTGNASTDSATSALNYKKEKITTENKGQYETVTDLFFANNHTNSRQSKESEPEQAEKKTIFIVDDDQQVLDVMSKLLVMSGYDVEIFGGTNRLLSALNPGNTLPDLILLDRFFPTTRSGENTLRMLLGRKDTKLVPVVYLSGQSEDPQDHADWLNEGVAAVLAKSSPQSFVLATIKAVLRTVDKTKEWARNHKITSA
ncbi:MAG: response regulator [Desulfamplus sp.]|nr:response regulator [Desulfamplus sp.]